MAVGVSPMSMLRSSAVGDWEVCGDAFYSRELLYDMMWEDVDLENKRICAAPYGGPIAIVRDERQMVVVTAGSIRPVVRIFAASGRPLGSLLWERGRIAAWGWSDELELLVVDDAGRVVVVSMHGEKLREFSMGVAVERLGVAKALVYSDGVVVLTQQSPQLWAVVGLASQRPVPLAALPQVLLQGDPAAACMAVIEPRLTASGALEVLLGTPTGICQVDDASAVEHPLPGTVQPAAPPAAAAAPASTAPGEAGPQGASVLRLATSSDGSFVAAYSSDGRVHVFSADFTKQLSEFDTKADEVPLEVAWCGSDAVVVRWPELLLVIGPFGDAASWPLSGEKLLLVQEIDGLRLVSSQRHELLRKVPRALAEVQRPGSTAPAAQLWDARDYFEQHNASADRMLRSLSPQGLREAVAACVEAAGLDLSPARQKALLRAACFGGAFCSPAIGTQEEGGSSSEPSFYATCCNLRVLNALREASPGIPLTLPQLHALSLHVVVARLVAYREWLLAYQIAGSIQHRGGGGATAAATSLGAATASTSGAGLKASATMYLAASSPQEQVLLQWACAKISSPSSSGLPDHELKEQITAKLKACPGVHFAPLAGHAQGIGRRRLALKLLEEETSCSLQVPLLLSLSVGAERPAGSSAAGSSPSHEGHGEEEGDILLRALRKAIESGDTDLVYLVLFHIYKHRSLQDFWTIVSSKSLPRNLFIKFCKAREPELLETILTVNQQTTELAEQQLRRCLAQYTASHRGGPAAGDTALLKLTSGLADVATKYGTSRDHAFQAKAMSEFAQLRREQARLERETGQRLFVGLSLVDTVRTCIRLGHHKQAAALKKTFGINDKRFYWLKVLTLCEEHNWLALDELAVERKSPIGWEPFLQLARRNGAPREVLSRIISRMPDSTAKAELFTSIDCPREAAEVAAKLRDSDLFARIQGMVQSSSPAGLAIAQIRERFQSSSSFRM